LQVGQTRALTPDEAACFRLAAHSGARYALAAFDTRSVEGARSGPESGPQGEAVYTLGDGSPMAPTIVPSFVRAEEIDAASPGDLRVRASASTAPGDPFARATPWREGERFPLRRHDRAETATARVIKLHGGRFAFAVIEDDEGSHTRRFLDQATEAMEFLVRQGVPVWERAFGPAAPVTSAGAGQLLVVFASWAPEGGAGIASTQANPDGSGVGSVVWMNLEMRPGVRDHFETYDFASYRLKVLAHEITHAWQMRWAYDTQPAGPRAVSFGPVWALEGAADLVSLDLVRRFLGVGLTANYDWSAQLRTLNRNIAYAMEPADTRGRLARGYFDASSFLRDLQLRLVRRGRTPDDALAEVARGAVEGWFGVDGAGVRRQGLTARMRAALDPRWEPADAVLLWTLTQAVDDQTGVPELNNAAYARVSDDDAQYAWKPAVDDLEAGRAFAYEVRGTPGGSFYVRLKDGGKGGVFSARSTLTGARWMLVRSR
ncbi:MAG TPA: hypothetical protein VHG91_02000, partial [Longimicrobium sp.]|nr:hypothetical protein [Longimicrobium sp.]